MSREKRDKEGLVYFTLAACLPRRTPTHTSCFWGVHGGIATGASKRGSLIGHNLWRGFQVNEDKAERQPQIEATRWLQACNIEPLITPAGATTRRLSYTHGIKAAANKAGKEEGRERERVVTYRLRQ